MDQQQPITVALTGASGALYGLRLVEVLLDSGLAVDFLLSEAARVVLERECGLSWQGGDEAVAREVSDYFRVDAGRLRYFGVRDWFSPLASGSGGVRKMVVCPCSMGTLAAIAGGMSDNLIERAADVTIKEGGDLILVPRETPFSVIHLENMLKLARLGVVILPAAPGFYHGAQGGEGAQNGSVPDQDPPRVAELSAPRVSDLVDFLVGRILNRLKIPHKLTRAWPEVG
ncbi:MAG: UbiX family flavin prenyltransferase [Magnetococcales bacterium]|nr:UbiX family flavin prenyltransferase [Magnetococcales bacterium]